MNQTPVNRLEVLAVNGKVLKQITFQQNTKGTIVKGNLLSPGNYLMNPEEIEVMARLRVKKLYQGQLIEIKKY